jgi:type III restriction enzyme
MVRQQQPDLVTLKEGIEKLAHEIAHVPLAVAVPAQVSQPLMPLGSQSRTVTLGPGGLDLQAFQAHALHLAGKVRVRGELGEVTIFVPLSREDEERAVSLAKNDQGRAEIAAAVESVRAVERAFGTGEPRLATPFELQLDFLVPLLCVTEQVGLFEFEKTHLIEHQWRLSEKDASLPASYDPRSRPGLRAGSVDVGATGQVNTAVVVEGEPEDFIGRLRQQTLGFDRPEDWTIEELVQWLDTKIEHRDIPPEEAAEYLRKSLRGIMTRYGLTDVAALALDRFRLRDQIGNTIQSHRQTELNSAFQQWLLPASGLIVSPERSLDFSKLAYEPSWTDDSGFVFKKHYYGPKPGELKYLKSNRALTEEFQCAQFIDSLPEVEYWVRNLSRKPSSFRLQTSSDYFYPDFVCRLKDGRILVIEYKGGDEDTAWYASRDSEEKRMVGAIWESRSNGRCLFLMPPGPQWDLIEKKIRG